MATNLDSVFHMCRLVVPHMRERRFGRIVNLAAVGAAGTQGEPQMTAYGAAKAGVVALSRALALEEARCGITVNVVSPGLLKDESGDKVAAAADAMLGDRVPVGHAGDAADVVRAVLFFASPAADFVTGQVVEVAGGARSVAGGRSAAQSRSARLSSRRTTVAVKPWSSTSPGASQASAGSPAFSQVCARKASRSQPCSTGTCGSSTPRRSPQRSSRP